MKTIGMQIAEAAEMHNETLAAIKATSDKGKHMKAMSELMSVLMKDNIGVKPSEIAVRIGTNRSTFSRCERGLATSPALAELIAKKYGGRCIAWAAEVRKAYMRKRTNNPGGTTKSSSYHVETHQLTPINPDDILAGMLPVVHAGQPLWA